MRSVLNFAGVDEIDDSLAALPRAARKPVIRRALKKQLKPVAREANNLWAGAGQEAFGVSEKLRQSQPKVSPSNTAVTMYVGSTNAAPHAHLIEFGTEPRYHKSGKYVGAVAPDPSLGPAWDAHKDQILSGIAEEIGKEIEATLNRRSARGR
ncbi:hypothetical protein [Phaeobacter sp. C3_T13_0]|uniref:hypothetical protein n=1 Tax=Phaeobacter cretensis TaxID=3342641 RepID=UPI0039BD8014